jgi:SnoaL-like domain
MSERETKSGQSLVAYAGQPTAFSRKSPAERAQEVADREEIRDLIATYAHRVAHGLSNADLFVDDGAYIQRNALDGPIVQERRGRAELDDCYIERLDSIGNATPMIHNILLAVDGNTAIGTCSIELRIRSGKLFGSGFYEDSFRHEDGRWKFVERHSNFFYWGPADAF